MRDSPLMYARGAGKEDRYEEQKADMKKGLFYLLKTTVEYDGKMWFL